MNTRNVIICMFMVLFWIAAYTVDARGAGTFGPQSSNRNVEWGFDFVETFDNLRDWLPSNPGNGNVTDQSKMPKRSDGSDSAWTYYSFWGNSDGSKWIDNFGTDNVWQGTGKSARIDLGNTKGPSRFGLYYGDGSADSGYTEVYIFYMVRIPMNIFPTSCTSDCYNSYAGGTGRYSQSEYDRYGYHAWEAWKFNTVDIGMEGSMVYQGSFGRYSPYHIIPHIRRSRDLGDRLAINYQPNDNGDRSNVWCTDEPKSVEDFMPGWWGFEMRLRNVVEGSGKYTYTDIWLYDRDGNSWQVLDGFKKQYTSQPSSHKWNHFFFGGNYNECWTPDSSMVEHYYVDDLIINSSRIGPNYFSMLGGRTVPVPGVPGDPIIE